MPLNIAINADYRITSDSMNVIVNKRFTVDPKKSPNWPRMQAEGASGELRDDWRELSYHRKVEDALQEIVTQTVLGSDATSIPQLLDEIVRLRREISGVMDV